MKRDKRGRFMPKYKKESQAKRGGVKNPSKASLAKERERREQKLSVSLTQLQKEQIRHEQRINALVFGKKKSKK